MISLTWGGVSSGFTAIGLAARFATCGEAMEAPESFVFSPPGM